MSILNPGLTLTLCGFLSHFYENTTADHWLTVQTDNSIEMIELPTIYSIKIGILCELRNLKVLISCGVVIQE